jgi:hypothetical protein
MDETPGENTLGSNKIAGITVAGIIILALSLYAGYRYSQSKRGNIMLPGGATYLGNTPTPIPQAASPTPLPKFTATATIDWKDHAGEIYPYTISYPSTLPIVIFPTDPNDSVAIVWNNVPPQQNILINIERIDSRDPKLVDQSKIEYVRNWYKFFTGLKGIANLEEFTNASGLKGYRASYLNTENTSPNIDVFFEVPKQKTILIHLANGMIDEKIFNKIVDNVKWDATTPIKKFTSSPSSASSSAQPLTPNP